MLVVLITCIMSITFLKYLRKVFFFLSLYQLVYFLLLKNNGIFYAYPKCEGRSGIWHKNLNDRKNKLFINFKIS